jgi:arylsulfatase A
MVERENSKIGRREFLRLGAAGAAAAALPGLALETGCSRNREGRNGRPNFLVILCDDLGYGDLGCYGNQVIRTRHIDRLAGQGVRLTDCYAAAPMCSPSRAGLLTGRTPDRIGIYDYIPPNDAVHLPPGEITVATLLRECGYETCHVGKWHCNGRFNHPDQPQPPDHGFDYWFGTQHNALPNHCDPVNFVRNGRPVGKIRGYSCQIVVDEAIGWLKEKRNREKPFFQFVCFHEPHEPIASPPHLVSRYAGAKKKGEALYYANVQNMDIAVGRLMAALDEMDLADDTLLLFTSDNGPQTLAQMTWRSYGSAGPLRGRKRFLFEGGIRVPGIFRWPRRIEPGGISGEPVSGLDVLPTFCRLAGTRPPGDRTIDGSSFTALFGGKAVERTIPLHWHFYDPVTGPMSVIREDEWIVTARWDLTVKERGRFKPEDQQVIKNAGLVNFKLYNIREDIGQTSDLSTRHPGRFEKMCARLSNLHRQVHAEGAVW